MRLYISTNTKKLYKKGKKQSPDWNAYARIDSLTIHTKEIPEELLTALNNFGYQTNSNNSFTYDYTYARTNPLTWQNLKKGIDFPAIDIDPESLRMIFLEHPECLDIRKAIRGKEFGSLS